ncbi:MAG: hypothetical protein NZ578_09895 [Candidatus Binatia bacterium]|nr:hypothetical protein [Candidatus Binatia bacterium]
MRQDLRQRLAIVVCGMLVLYGGSLLAQEGEQGTLVIQALGEAGKRSDAKVYVYAANTQTPIATTTVGTPVALPPGVYRLELDVVGGKIVRENTLVKAGRTSTVMVNEVAGLQVNVLDRKGQDLGLGVEIYDSVSGEKLGDFLSGDLILVYPGVVDVKVATPPQGQWWRKVELQSGGRAELSLRERVKGELRVLPLLNGRDASAVTQVIIYEAGTQKEVSRSEPSPEHRFALDAGEYDVFVANPTGKGKPFVLERAEVKGEETVEKTIPLDEGQRALPSPTQAL